jgi:phosphoenolpyruvate carboxykinase (ATP)
MGFLLSDIARGIVESAKAEKRITGDLKEITELSKKDATTCLARGTKDALTEMKSHAYITKTTSRSALQTRVYLGELDDEARKLCAAVAEYLKKEKISLLSIERQMGLTLKHSTVCQTVVTKPYARLLHMWDKLLFPVDKEHAGKQPHQILIQVPEWGEVSAKYLPEWHAKQKAADSPLKRIIVDAEAGVTFVLGSDYFGEIKKGHLRMAMYREKANYRKSNGRKGGLGVHAGGKLIRARDAKTKKLRDLGALFFGLSGTGKTSLSVHHFWLESGGERVIIRQDDFFVLDKDARAFGTEDNAYIKTEGLEPVGQPLLYQGAMKESAVLENVFVDPKTRKVDFFRYEHPFTPNKKCLNGRGIVARKELVDDNGVPQADDSIDLKSVGLVFFITRRDTIVPPVAKLTHDQAAAYFMLGESIITSAADPVRAGQSVREVGTNPFIVGSEGEEGNIFYEILAKNPKTQCYLLNTGSFGGRTVELGSGMLSEKKYVEAVERYSKGIAHPKAGSEMTIGENKFVVRNVKIEAQANGQKVFDPKALGEILEQVREGKADAEKIRVFEFAQLVADKITVQDSCTIIREIARGNVEWEKDAYWGYDVAKRIPGIELSRFNFKKYYSDEEHEGLNSELKSERIEWLSKFPEIRKEIARAIPR